MNLLFIFLACAFGSLVGLFFCSLVKVSDRDIPTPEGQLEVKVKYFDDSVEKIKKYNYGDCIDLRAEIDMDFYKGDFKLIPLNVAMELPKGYEAHIIPRSSTFKNYGIIQTNHCGK